MVAKALGWRPHDAGQLLDGHRGGAVPDGLVHLRNGEASESIHCLLLLHTGRRRHRGFHRWPSCLLVAGQPAFHDELQETVTRFYAPCLCLCLMYCHINQVLHAADSSSCLTARLAEVALAEADLLAPCVAADDELSGVDLALHRQQADRRARRRGAAGVGHLVREPNALPLPPHVEQPGERRCGVVQGMSGCAAEGRCS